MLTVIGCGNLNRSDDGVGVIVARILLEKFGDDLPPDTQIFDAGTDGMGVMFKARGSQSLIIIDASDTGSDPGAVFEIPGHELEGKPPDSYNLHDFRWDHALYAGRQIFKQDFPSDVQVFLIEAKTLEYGLELSSDQKYRRLPKQLRGGSLTGFRCRMSEEDGEPGASIMLKRGSLYLSRGVYERYFAELDAVILLRRDDDLCILPVRNTAGGGYLLKLKNMAGDRIINAMDFFREHGREDFAETVYKVFWDQDLSALRANGLFVTDN